MRLADPSGTHCLPSSGPSAVFYGWIHPWFLGLLYFVAVSLLALARIRGVAATPEWAQPAAFSMTLAGTLFVAYLTYVELFVLEAICVWCVALAALTVASFGLVAWGSLSGEQR